MSKKINKTIFIVSVITVGSFLIGLFWGAQVTIINKDKEIYNLNSSHISTIETLVKETEKLSNRITILNAQNLTQSEIIEEYIKVNSKKEYQVDDNIFQSISSNKWGIGESVPLPSLPTNIKSYTDYHFYNVDGTPHKRLQQVAWTDDYGCRRYNNDYIVALGSFYSVDIGDRFEVTLDSGNVFTIILGDGKADVDTDPTNMYAPCVNYEGEQCANVIEFIIDKNVVSIEAYRYGSMDYYDLFKGNIIKMVYLGRDTSADWDTYN